MPADNLTELLAGALPWLKDPFDPEAEPLQQVLTSSILAQLEREATSLATMSCLAVLLVHMPIKLAGLLAPSLFPVAFHHLESVTEVPADMLLLHVCLLFTIPHLKFRSVLLARLLSLLLLLLLFLLLIITTVTVTVTVTITPMNSYNITITITITAAVAYLHCDCR